MRGFSKAALCTTLAITALFAGWRIAALEKWVTTG